MPLTFEDAVTALTPRTPAGKTEDYINRAVERLMASGGVRGLTEKATFTVRSTPTIIGGTEAPTGSMVLEGSLFTGADGVYAESGTAGDKPKFVKAVSAAEWFSVYWLTGVSSAWCFTHVTEGGDRVSLIISSPEDTVTPDLVVGAWKNFGGTDSAATVTAETATSGGSTTPAETLILPAQYSTILGCIIRGVQTGVAAEWYPYQPGVSLDSAGLPTHPITDLGLDQATGLRSYHVPIIDGNATLSVTARVRRQHVELAADADLVPITNLSALGLAVDAIGYEQAGDFDNSAKYMNRAISILRDERVEADPENQASSPVRIHFTGEGRIGGSSFY